MGQINSKQIIQTTEKNLRSLWGDVFYEEVKDFFRNFIVATNVDKILITRRSYVLYKIFCKIFFVSQLEEDAKAQKALEKNVNCVYTTHSLPLLFAKTQAEKKALLIVDDVIVNGRTINNVIEEIQGKSKDWKINLWCLRCNVEAAYFKELEPYLRHAIFLSPYEWEMVSDRLTDAVIMSNIGYVSFLKTYWLTEESYSQFIKCLSENNFYKKDYTIETHSKDDEGLFSLKCTYFLDDKNFQYGIKCPFVIRLYKTDWSYLAIPYIVLPSLNGKDLLSLCSKISNEVSGPLSKDIKDIIRIIIKFSSQKGIIVEDQVCKDTGVLIYQAIVSFLSNSYFENILHDYLGDNFLNQIEVCFDPIESFSIYEASAATSKESNELNDKAIDLLSPNRNIALINSKLRDQISQEIDTCRDTLASVTEKDDSFLSSMSKYFTKVRKMDDIRANQNTSRLYGISLDDIKTWFFSNKSIFTNTTISDSFLDLIYLWDTGMASCVILSKWDQEKKSLVFSEFVRHGEQAFRAIYSMYPNEYSVLRRFSQVNDSYSESEVFLFAQYYSQLSGSSDILRLSTKIEYETFFADCMAVSPKSVGAKLDDDSIDKIVKSYQSKFELH